MSQPDSAGKLVIIRGNSGSGKSSVAKELVRWCDGRVALVEQDYLRRNVLGEKDIEDGDNIALIEQTVCFALDRCYDVVLEGILDTRRYADLLARLTTFARECFVFYLDVSLEESLRRHATKDSTDFGEDALRRWYRASDLSHLPGETVVPETSELSETVRFIQHLSGLEPSPGPVRRPDST
jgi:adenylate kinase family enzyme